MNQILKHILFGVVLLAVFCVAASAEDRVYYPEDTILYGEAVLDRAPAGADLGELLYFSEPEKHNAIVKIVYPSESTKSGVYTYGDRLKMTVTDDGALSVVTHSVRENSEKASLSIPARILSFLGLHEVTDIHTITRTDYNKTGDILVKITLSGYFEIGSILPSAAHYTPIGYLILGDGYKLLGQDADEIDERTIYYYSAIKTGNETVGYNLYLILGEDGNISYIDEVGEPLVAEQPPRETVKPNVVSFKESPVYTVQYTDRGLFAPQITARMSAWFTYDRENVPEEQVIELVGISHWGNYRCDTEYFVTEDAEHGQIKVTGVVTAYKVSNPEERHEYILTMYFSKYGDYASQQMKK